MPEWLEVAVRTLLAVVVLFILTKLLGKRQISQLSTFEYITGITIGNLAGFISLDLKSSWYLGLVSVIVWAGVSMGIEMLQIKSKRARNILDGRATVIVNNGMVLEGNLKKERLSSDELLEELRRKGIFRLADVEFAIMETSGELNVLLKTDSQPLTLKHLGIPAISDGVQQVVIMDGNIMDEALAEAGYSRQWLMRKLGKRGLTTDHVYMAQVTSNGQLYVDLYEDKIRPPAHRNE